MARRDLDDWLWQIGAELQKLSEEIGPTAPRLAKSRRWEPHIDLIETDDFLLLKAEVAGVRGEDIRISYRSDRHTLTIRGIRGDENPETVTAAHHLEIHYGEFEREVKLPTMDLDASRISAGFRNGILAVVVPKTGRARERVIVSGTIKITRR